MAGLTVVGESLSGQIDVLGMRAWLSTGAQWLTASGLPLPPFGVRYIHFVGVLIRPGPRRNPAHH